MSKPRRIYLLSPKDLSPETIAVTFAKTSRSPKPFDEIAAELTDERSAKFHEKWVVGYGHASVAEHAVLHLALENVSRLAIEEIEGNRLASYTEKSTRYQQWDDDAFYVPEEIKGHRLEQDYTDTCQNLFSAYQNSIPKVKAWLKHEQPQAENENDQAYARRIQPAAVDICRFLLPAASLANVGVTINARSLEYAICKMLSSPLEEVQSIGEKLREVGRLETPTLIKYAACNPYLVATREKMNAVTQGISTGDGVVDVNLISWDQDGENAVLAAVLLRFGNAQSYQACYDFVIGLSEGDKDNLVHEIMDERGQFDQPLRELEYARMTFEVVMDQGAYFEFKRHRMMTQTVQPLSADLGFAIPKGMTMSGCETDYLEAIRQAGSLFRELRDWNPHVASYIIPNAFNRRVLFDMNLRQAYHLCRLRAAENAHFSIQRVALAMAEKIKAIYPCFGQYLDVPGDTTWQAVEKEYFSSIRSM